MHAKLEMLLTTDQSIRSLWGLATGNWTLDSGLDHGLDYGLENGLNSRLIFKLLAMVAGQDLD